MHIVLSIDSYKLLLVDVKPWREYRLTNILSIIVHNHIRLQLYNLNPGANGIVPHVFQLLVEKALRRRFQNWLDVGMLGSEGVKGVVGEAGVVPSERLREEALTDRGNAADSQVVDGVTRGALVLHRVGVAGVVAGTVIHETYGLLDVCLGLVLSAEWDWVRRDELLLGRRVSVQPCRVEG